MGTRPSMEALAAAFATGLVLALAAAPAGAETDPDDGKSPGRRSRFRLGFLVSWDGVVGFPFLSCFARD